MTPSKRTIVSAIAVIVLAAMTICFIYGLAPASVSASAPPVVFTIVPGESSLGVVSSLGAAGLLRSPPAAAAFSLFTGSAFSFQPGAYRLSAAMSAPAMLRALSDGEGREVSVTIPPGANIYQADAILANALVIRPHDLVDFHADGNLEGKLFPDTYRFFTGSSAVDVVQKFLGNFNAKAGPLLAADGTNATSDLVMASIVEKEVPDGPDQALVAGILRKRINAGMPLQADATICYAMQLADAAGAPDCGTLDLKIDSPYNTYLYKGLPPGPIGSPGLSAIAAAIHPERSPYWYYLSDPKTGKTIFAATLDEQHQNTVKYLDSH